MKSTEIRAISLPAAIGTLGAVLLGTAGIGLLAGSWDVLNDTSKVAVLLLFSGAIGLAWRLAAKALPTISEVLRSLVCLALPLDAVALCARFGGGWRAMILVGGCAGVVTTEVFGRKRMTEVLTIGQVCALMVGAAGVAANFHVPFAITLAGCALAATAIGRKGTTYVLSGLASAAPFVAPLYPFALGKGVLTDLGLGWTNLGSTAPTVGLLTFVTLTWSAWATRSTPTLLAAATTLTVNTTLGFAEQTPGRLVLAVLPAVVLLAIHIVCEVAAHTLESQGRSDRSVLDKWRFLGEFLVGTLGVLLLTPAIEWLIRPLIELIGTPGVTAGLELYLEDTSVRAVAIMALGLTSALSSVHNSTIDRHRKPMLVSTATLSLFAFLSIVSPVARQATPFVALIVAAGCLVLGSGASRWPLVAQTALPSDSAWKGAVLASGTIATLYLGGSNAAPWPVVGISAIAAICFWILFSELIIAHTSRNGIQPNRKWFGTVTTAAIALFAWRAAHALGPKIFGSSSLPFAQSVPERFFDSSANLARPLSVMLMMAIVTAGTSMVLRRRQTPGADGILTVVLGLALISCVGFRSLFHPATVAASLLACVHCVRGRSQQIVAPWWCRSANQGNFLLGLHLPLLAFAAVGAAQRTVIELAVAVAITSFGWFLWGHFRRTSEERKLIRTSNIGLIVLSWLSVLVILQASPGNHSTEALVLLCGALVVSGVSMALPSPKLRYFSGLLLYLSVERVTNPWSTGWRGITTATQAGLDALAVFGITAGDTAIVALCVALLLVGTLVRRADRRAGRPVTSSWVAYGYEIFLFALYCLVQSSERPGLLITAMVFGALSFSIGAVRKLAAPFTLGALAAGISATLVIRPFWNGLPEIVWFAAAGIALLALATTLEWRRRNGSISDSEWTLGRAIRHDAARQ